MMTLVLHRFWWHAVLNIGEVAAAGIQASESYTAWMKEIDFLGELERTTSDSKRKRKRRVLLSDLEKDATHMAMLLVHDRLGRHAPFNAVHHFFIGLEYVELGEYALAEQYLQEALLMDPALIEAYLALARIYLDSDRLWHRYQADRLLRIAYVLNHNHPKVREGLISVLTKQHLDDLVDKVLRHEPLPPVTELSQRELDRQQEADSSSRP